MRARSTATGVLRRAYRHWSRTAVRAGDWVGRPASVRLQPPGMADQAALAPVVIVEEIRHREQHPGVVGPHGQQLVAVVLGLLDELAQPPLGVRPELRPDGVGGIDVEAVQGEPAGRAVGVEREVEEGADQAVAGDQQIPVRAAWPAA